VATERNLSHDEAARLVERSQAERDRFLQTFYIHDLSKPVHFDLTIDSSRFNNDQIAEIILCALMLRFGERLTAE